LIIVRTRQARVSAASIRRWVPAPIARG
jgi:hypothetical protein